MTRTTNAFRLFALKLALPLLLLSFVARVAAAQTTDPDCEKIKAPAGAKAVLHAYAEGVQIYRWNGTAWVFVAPQATLFANPGGDGPIGIHYVGPTWESASGSKVVAAVLNRCTPDANSIPWLSLAAVSNGGAGIFDRVTFIQRVNTVGGKAPTVAGSFAGEVVNIPYLAEYFFYRTDN